MSESMIESINQSTSPSVRGGVGRPIGSALRSVSRCRVCGFSEVRTDEVLDRGTVLLAECPRCEYRWTTRLAGPAVVRPPARGVRGVSSAA